MTISYGMDFSLSIQIFHILPEVFISEAEVVYRDMMYGFEPEVNLSIIKDDLTD